MNLDKILRELGLDAIGDQVIDSLRDAAEIKLGAKGGEQLGRAICETVDSILESTGTGTVEQRALLARKLADEAANVLELCAEKVRLYPAAQAEVVAAKASGDKNRLKQARAVRTAAAMSIKQSLGSAARAAAGGVE